MKQEKQNTGMSGWSWVMVAAVLAFTVGGTWNLAAITSSMGGLALLVRQAAAVLFSDGALLYWHFHRDKYPTDRQRKIASFMLWEALALILAFSAGYMLLSVMGSAWSKAMLTVTIAGYPLAASVTEWLDVLVLFCLAGQAAGTLYAVLKIASLSPQAQMTLRQKQAEQEVMERQLSDYETAQKTIAPIVGQAQAVAALRGQLTALGYNERERERLVALAMAKIQESRAASAGTVEREAVPLRLEGLSALEGEAVPAIPFGGNGHKP